MLLAAQSDCEAKKRKFKALKDASGAHSLSLMPLKAAIPDLEISLSDSRLVTQKLLFSTL
jgi:hypothetical protein